MSNHEAKQLLTDMLAGWQGAYLAAGSSLPEGSVVRYPSRFCCFCHIVAQTFSACCSVAAKPPFPDFLSYGGVLEQFGGSESLAAALQLTALKCPITYHISSDQVHNFVL